MMRVRDAGFVLRQDVPASKASARQIEITRFETVGSAKNRAESRAVTPTLTARNVATIGRTLAPGEDASDANCHSNRP
jgi:hypothetical protein